MSDLSEIFGPNVVIGNGKIAAEVIADSVNPWGDRLTTFRLHYPRMIHAELMTHRMFSRNASSSRAIPVKRVLESIHEEPAMPVHWGKNQPGMQAKEECNELVGFDDDSVQITREEAWQYAAQMACNIAGEFDRAGYHKQVANRITEPYQFMNVVVSMTDSANWYWLRDHNDADPTIHELAAVMLEGHNLSEPEILRHGEWHTPYVTHCRDEFGVLHYFTDGKEVDLETAKKVSASCSAQASYRRLDTSIEKAIDIYDKLVGGAPLHASPFEHVAQPYCEDEHMTRTTAMYHLREHLTPIWGLELAESFAQQAMYCGNFRGWTQLRKTLPQENYTG